MKLSFINLFFFIFFVSGLSQTETGLLNHECDNRNQTLNLQEINEENSLFPYLIDDDRSGFIKIHPFTFDEIGGWETFQNSLTLNNQDYHYEFSRMTKSRYFDGLYYYYQQYFKGIPIEGGGFSILVIPDEIDAIFVDPCPACPPIGPCDGYVSAFSPNIYEGVDIESPQNPAISEEEIEDFLPESVSNIDSKELRIVNNLEGDCEYVLSWRIKYQDSIDGALFGWMNAETGELMYKTSQYQYKVAPTADHGDRLLNDSEENGITILKNDRLSVYDSPSSLGHTSVFFDPNDIPTSPALQIEWNEDDAPTEVFQLFWMADQVIDKYQELLEVEFTDVHAGYNPSFTGVAGKFTGLPDTFSSYVFGTSGGNPSVEYDIIAHELGHAVISQFISSEKIEGGSLHEAIADMLGTYIETEIEGSLDWVTGDNMAEDFVVRDLENTTNNCFTSVQNFDSKHDRGEALGHWFYLCVSGDAENDIPPMDMEEVINLVLEALPTLSENPDYPDLMNATVDLAKNIYTTCSDQFLTVMRAWEQICVPTGHRMAESPEIPCVELFGDVYVCEEDNHFQVCITDSGFNSEANFWRIKGRKNTSFTSQSGMTGSLQIGGDCLHITSIPDMPYYPQSITIRLWNSEIGEFLSRSISIQDCDGDGLTCEEYYGIAPLISQPETNFGINNNSQSESSDLGLTKFDNEENLNIIVFDIMGKKLNVTKKELMNNYNLPTQLVIVTYWDEKGKFVKSEKVLIQ